jgi:hypothetical protein
VIAWIRRWYGAHPLHLLALIAAFALAGYAVQAVVAAGQWRGFAIWFLASVIGHDLLLFPLYSLADLSLRRLLPRWAGGTRGTSAGTAFVGTAPAGAVPADSPSPVTPPVLNYVRIPAGLSVLLLAVWFPLILGLSSAPYFRASGLSTAPYLWRWLAVTGALFAGSAVCYALSLRRISVRARRVRASAGQRG